MEQFQMENNTFPHLSFHMPIRYSPHVFLHDQLVATLFFATSHRSPPTPLSFDIVSFWTLMISSSTVL